MIASEDKSQTRANSEGSIHDLFSHQNQKLLNRGSLVENKLILSCDGEAANFASCIRISGWSSDQAASLSAIESDSMRELEKSSYDTVIDLRFQSLDSAALSSSLQTFIDSKRGSFEITGDNSVRLGFHAATKFPIRPTPSVMTSSTFTTANTNPPTASSTAYSSLNTTSTSATSYNYNLTLSLVSSFKHLLSTPTASKYLSQGFSLSFQSLSPLAQWTALKQAIQSTALGDTLRGLLGQSRLASRLSARMSFKSSRLLYLWRSLCVSDAHVLTGLRNAVLSVVQETLKSVVGGVNQKDGGLSDKNGIVKMLQECWCSGVTVLAKLPNGGGYQVTAVEGKSLHYLIQEVAQSGFLDPKVASAEQTTPPPPILSKPTNTQDDKKSFSRKEELLRRKDTRSTLGFRKPTPAPPIVAKPEPPAPPIRPKQPTDSPNQDTTPSKPAPNPSQTSPLKPLVQDLPPPPPAPEFKPRPVTTLTETPKKDEKEQEAKETPIIPLPPPLKQQLLPKAAPEHIPAPPELKQVLQRGLLAVVQRAKNQPKVETLGPPSASQIHFLESFTNLQVMVMQKSSDLLDRDFNFFDNLPLLKDEEETRIPTAIVSPPESLPAEVIQQSTQKTENLEPEQPPIVIPEVIVPEPVHQKEDSYRFESNSKVLTKEEAPIEKNSDSYQFDDSKLEKSVPKPPEPEAPEVVNQSDSYRFDESEEKPPVVAADDSYEFD